MLSDSEACASGISCFLREMNPLCGFPSGRVKLQWYSLLRSLVEKLFINLLVFWVPDMDGIAYSSVN